MTDSTSYYQVVINYNRADASCQHLLTKSGKINVNNIADLSIAISQKHIEVSKRL